MYNAVNAIDGGFQPYKYSLTAPAGTSSDAAAIEASYRMLLYLLPDQAAFLTVQYDSSLAAIPDGDAKTKGQMLGLASAIALIALRAGDGRGASVPYTFPSVPTAGVWILTPGATASQPLWVGQMRPFTSDDPARVLPEPLADLGSDTWAKDYNEVKTVGELNSAVRTPEQTQQARFWLDDGASQYGRMLRAMAAQRQLSPVPPGRGWGCPLKLRPKLSRLSKVYWAIGALDCPRLGQLHYLGKEVERKREAGDSIENILMEPPLQYLRETMPNTKPLSPFVIGKLKRTIVI